MTGGRTDEQWQALLTLIARRILEVERGLRPPSHLEGLMPASTFRAWDRRRNRGSLAGGPVRPRDIGTVRFAQTGRTLTASVVTATAPGRWGALTLQLRCGRDDRWRIVDLHRLAAGRHYRHRPAAEPSRHAARRR